MPRSTLSTTPWPRRRPARVEVRTDHATMRGDLAPSHRAFVTRRIALLGALVVLLCFAVALIGGRWVEHNAKDNELGTAALLALAPPEHRPALLAASGREAVVSSPGQQMKVLLSSDSIDDERFRRWRVRIRNEALRGQVRQFTSIDPTGAEWWFTRVSTTDGALLVVGRPVDQAMALASGLNRVLALTALALLTGLAGLWLTLRRSTGEPLGSLLAAGQDLRLRGAVREETRRALQSHRTQPAEYGEIARIIEEIRGDSVRGHAEAEALLSSASALGGSLDQATVLARTLEQLQGLLGVDRSVILSYEPRGDTFDIVSSRGHSSGYLDDLLREPPDPGAPSRRALHEHHPVQLPDTEATIVPASIRERGRRHNYRSILAVPLTAKLERPTVLLLHASVSRTYSYDEIELSKSFGSIAGAAIRNAELFARTDEGLRRSSSLLDAIIESVEQGMFVTDPGGSVVYANARMRALIQTGVTTDGSDGGAAPLDHVDDLRSFVAAHAVEPKRAATIIGELIDQRQERIDIDLASPEGRRAFQIRGFGVIDTRGEEIGRGQVWTDRTSERELDSMKQGLLATVSHEFRTPLALIKGYATTLLADDVDWPAEDKHEFLTMVNVEADRLTALVQRLLDMRRIDAGMVSLHRLPVELSTLVHSTLDAMPHQRGRISVGDIPEVAVSVDGPRIVTVLRNLLENACTHSATSASVELGLEADGDSFTCTIRDHGAGVDESLVPHLFDTFVRGDNALDAEFGGLGLGLAIARGFVEAHDGTIWIRCPEEGFGAEFGFQIPLGSVGVSELTPSISSSL